jgi:large subunit ribosomal protein L29
VDLKELRAMADAELIEKEAQLKQELFNLRFQLATGRIENPMRIRQAKRTIAQVKTLLRQHLSASQSDRQSNKGLNS